MKKIIIILIVLILVIGACIYGYRAVFSSKEAVEEIIPTPTVVLPTVSEDIAVELVPKNSNKEVSLTISGIPPDIESIEYELTYNTGSGLPRGVLGKITLKGEDKITRDDIVLGTCSSGRCVYDTGVSEINLSLKFNSTTGSSSVFQKTYSF